MPPLSSNIIINYLGTPFSDPHYDRLLEQFSSDHPVELETWRNVERDLFESRPGLNEHIVYIGRNVDGAPVEPRPGVRLGGYPDQQLMKFCLNYLSPKLPFGVGDSGSHHAWQALRGRILRALIDEDPRLNPAPGKVLITEPRTCTDAELTSVVENFIREQPTTWSEWQRIEGEKGLEDGALRHVAVAFHRFIRDHCWAQSTTALASIFMDVRNLFSRAAGQA